MDFLNEMVLIVKVSEKFTLHHEIQPKIEKTCDKTW